MQRKALTVDIWQHTAVSSHSTTVVPDGCRDLICHALPGQRPTWFVTDLADASYDVPGTVGECFWGFRMQPGVQVDAARLLATLDGRTLHDAREALPLLHDCVHLDVRVEEALASLAQFDRTATAARMLGVSERTLQRLVQGATDRTPIYWKRLARVRRAAQALLLAPTLADCAADHGYVDQAHMTREFKHWLGATPTAAMARPELLSALAASGYG
jgi:AraC-like DNA-binding protein